VALPDGSEILVVSSPPKATDAGPALGTDVTAWLRAAD
jgi:hypothetical protein